MDSLSDADFTRIIHEVHKKPSAKVTLARADAEALMNEIVRLRGVIYDLKQIHRKLYEVPMQIEAILYAGAGQ